MVNEHRITSHTISMIAHFSDKYLCAINCTGYANLTQTNNKDEKQRKRKC